MDIINVEDKEIFEFVWVCLLNMIIKLIMYCFWVCRNRCFVCFCFIFILVFYI